MTRIAGVVSGPGGAPVPSARVYFVAGPGALPDVAALTDAQGRFTLSAALAGTYVIQCVADGIGKADVKAVVGREPEVRVRVKLG